MQVVSHDKIWKIMNRKKKIWKIFEQEKWFARSKKVPDWYACWLLFLWFSFSPWFHLLAAKPGQLIKLRQKTDSNIQLFI